MHNVNNKSGRAVSYLAPTGENGKMVKAMLFPGGNSVSEAALRELQKEPIYAHYWESGAFTCGEQEAEQAKRAREAAQRDGSEVAKATKRLREEQVKLDAERAELARLRAGIDAERSAIAAERAELERLTAAATAPAVPTDAHGEPGAPPAPPQQAPKQQQQQGQKQNR